MKLLEFIATNTGFSKEKVSIIITAMFLEIQAALMQREKVIFKRFAYFARKKRFAFKPSKVLLENIYGR